MINQITANTHTFTVSVSISIRMYSSQCISIM